MNIPAAPESEVTREHVHTRTVRMDSYRRSDGLWDIEALLVDVRDYASFGVERGPIAAGEHLHEIRVCVTVDNDMVVRAASASMQAHPYHTCPQALPPVAGLVGGTLARGWRKHVDTHLGGDLGCSHIREVLQHIATAAYQTIPVWRAQQSGDVIQAPDGAPPQHLGQCKAWSFQGPVVARIYPQFVEWKSSRDDVTVAPPGAARSSA
jgi:hypothetical protein